MPTEAYALCPMPSRTSSFARKAIVFCQFSAIELEKLNLLQK